MAWQRILSRTPPTEFPDRAKLCDTSGVILSLRLAFRIFPSYVSREEPRSRLVSSHLQVVIAPLDIKRKGHPEFTRKKSTPWHFKILRSRQKGISRSCRFIGMVLLDTEFSFVMFH